MSKLKMFATHNVQDHINALESKNLLFDKIAQLHPETIFNESTIGISNENNFDVFQKISCPKCERLLEDPCTVSCGCTICKKCYVDQKSQKNCNFCLKERDTNSSNLGKTNHVINNIQERFFKRQIDSLKILIGSPNDLKKESLLGVIENALNTCSENYLAWLKRAKILMEMKEFEEALVSANEAINLKPDYITAYLEKSKILIEIDRDSDAVVNILKSLFINVFDKDAEALLNKAMIKVTSSCLNQKVSFNDKDSVISMESNKNEINNDIKRRISCPVTLIAERFAKEVKYRSLNNNSLENKKTLLSEDELKELSDDLECTLCRRVFFEPVTTTCGHVFCKECLTRWLDYNSGCPVCRFSLFHYINIWKMEVTTLIDELVKAFFPDEMKERIETRTAENKQLAQVADDTDGEIPIFVCCTALPKRPLQLHIFEPRYRLMLRQCLAAGSKQFGMCTYDKEHGFARYGTMVEVKEVVSIADGRAFADCIGGRRFKIISSSVRDGYNTAKVEWIKDTQIPQNKLDEIKNLHSKVYADVKSFLENICIERDLLLSTIDFPGCVNDQIETRDGPDWIWWLVDNFVYSDELKVMLLSTNSLEQRLEVIQRRLFQR